MKRIEKFLRPWQRKLTAVFRRDFSAVCGLYEEGEVCSIALLTGEGERISGTFKREDARLRFAALLQEKGLKPEMVAGAAILPEVTLLDSYEQQMENLSKNEMKGVVNWSLRSRETVMEQPVWQTSYPVSREDASGVEYRIAAIPREEGEKGAALIRSLSLEPLAVYVMEGKKLPAYRIGVPDLQEKREGDLKPAEAAARFLRSALGDSLSEGNDKGAAEEKGAMNFLPLEQRAELYRWSRVVGLMLILWLALLAIFFRKGQQEKISLAAALQQEESLLHRQAVTGEEYRRLMDWERSVTALEAAAVRLSAERQPISPTLEALGAFTPAGIRLTELKGSPEGVVEIKGAAKSRGLVDRFIETYRQEMEPGTMRLKNISGGVSVSLGGTYEWEFTIILGEERRP